MYPLKLTKGTLSSKVLNRLFKFSIRSDLPITNYENEIPELGHRDILMIDRGKHLLYDSGIESDFAQDMENNARVKVYASNFISIQ